MTKANRPHINLTRRERQIMDVLYSAEEASASAVHEALPDAPSYSTVRALLAKLLDKDIVTYRQEGQRYFYSPVLPKQAAQQSAWSRLLDTFFGGSPAAAVVSLLGSQGDSLSKTDLAEIEAELQRLKTKGRPD